MLLLNIEHQEKILKKIKEILSKEKDRDVESLKIYETRCGSKRCYAVQLGFIGSSTIKCYYIEK